jgi:CheY-like chemotaxis protein
MSAGRILLVDDDELLCDVLADFLEMAGHEVVKAGNGIQALKQLDTGTHFDLIVLDLLMPEMDGIRFLRTLEERGSIGAKVLVLSASASSDVVNALDFGSVVGIVRKPVRPDDLQARIDSLLGT